MKTIAEELQEIAELNELCKMLVDKYRDDLAAAIDQMIANGHTVQACTGAIKYCLAKAREKKEEKH